MNLFIRKYLGQSIVVFLVFLPIFRWFTIQPLSQRFFDINSVALSLGRLTGIIGVMLFLIDLVLNCRFNFLGKMFCDAGQIYKNHHLIGAISFCLLLFHPLFLVVGYLRLSNRSAALFLLPSADDWAKNFGIIALLAMMILIIFAFLQSIKHSTWKIIHNFLIFVFALSIIHMYLVKSDISRDMFLRYYILGLSALALSSIIYIRLRQWIKDAKNPI